MTNNIKKPSQTSWAQKKAFFLSSLSHNKRDFTVAPIKYSLGFLAIPMMLEMSMEAIFAVVVCLSGTFLISIFFGEVSIIF